VLFPGTVCPSSPTIAPSGTRTDTSEEGTSDTGPAAKRIMHGISDECRGPIAFEIQRSDAWLGRIDDLRDRESVGVPDGADRRAARAERCRRAR